MTPLAATEAERLERERKAFEEAMNAARFFPAELDFYRTKSPSGRDEYENAHLESCWVGWQARASQQSAAQATAEPVASMSDLIAKHQVPKAARMAALCAEPVAPCRWTGGTCGCTRAQAQRCEIIESRNPATPDRAPSTVTPWQDRMAAHYAQGKSVQCHSEAHFMRQEIEDWRCAPSTDSVADARDAARWRYVRDTETLETAVWEALEGTDCAPGGVLDKAAYAAGMDRAVDAAIAASMPQKEKDNG